jgi:hypothetical protein
MKESYDKAVANHIGPESCLDDLQGRGEALIPTTPSGVGRKRRRAIELRKHLNPGADPVGWARRQHERSRRFASDRLSRRSQRTWHAWTLFARESGDLGKETAVAVKRP